MAAKKENLNPQLDTFSFWLSMHEPFWGDLFSYFPKTWDSSVEKLCVQSVDNSSLYVKINSDFWQQSFLSENHQSLFTDLIKKELLHLLLLHPFERKRYSHAALFQVACDLFLNVRLKADLQTAFDSSHFPTVDFTACKKVSDYYKQLTAANISANDIEAIVAKWPLLCASHSNWRAFQNLSKGQEDLLKQKVKQLFDTVTAKNKKQLPTRVMDSLYPIIKKAQQSKHNINWRRVIKQFAARNTGSKIVNTISRPSKRYGSSPGIKIKSRKKLLIAIDTSGSVDEKKLQAFYQAIHQLWQLNIDLQVVECDYEIKNQYSYKGVFPSYRSGGHVTDFTPPIHLANEQIRPAGIIYFTDGRGVAPKVQSTCPVLWVIAGDEQGKFEHLKGRKTFLKV